VAHVIVSIKFEYERVGVCHAGGGAGVGGGDSISFAQVSFAFDSLFLLSIHFVCFRCTQFAFVFLLSFDFFCYRLLSVNGKTAQEKFAASGGVSTIVLISTEFFVINSDFFLINSEFFLINTEFFLINTEFVFINSEFFLINTEFFLINSQFFLINSPFFLINTEFFLIKGDFFLINSDFFLLNAEFFLAWLVSQVSTLAILLSSKSGWVVRAAAFALKQYTTDPELALLSGAVDDKVRLHTPPTPSWPCSAGLSMTR
jgi:hypothetical protein